MTDSTPATAAAVPLWVTQDGETWVARNPFLRYTAIGGTVDELRSLVTESAEAEGWPSWVFHYAEEPEVTA